MGLLKKNLVFSIIVLICILAFLVGAYLAFAESGKISKAKQQITAAEAQLNNLRFAEPAPTAENVEASAKNVAELETVLKSIREDLQRGARITTSSDSISVMAAIQQYITEFQRAAAAHSDEAGEPTPISIKSDFAFGFEQYIDESVMLDDKERIPVLDKQRQILSYLLNKLIASNPHSIDAVQREALEVDQAPGQNSFRIDDVVSARVPGAIDTLGFSLTFTGYTDTLRSFLNNLAKFDLPIVVRSIEVDRPSGSQTTVAPTNRNNLDDIFGGFGGGASAVAEEPAEEQKPVISENISTFTVVLEFIEIVLPSDSGDDNA